MRREAAPTRSSARSVLISCAYSPANLGDGAIVSGMVQTLRRIDPDTRVHINTFTPDASLFAEMLGVAASPGLFFVPTLGSRWKRLRWLIKVFPAALLLGAASLSGRRALLIVARLTGRRRSGEIRRMADADLIVAAGGGYLNDYYSAIVPFIMLELLVASGTGTPVVLGAQTIGPLQSRMMRSAFRLLAKRLRGIELRDRYSMEQVAAVAPEVKEKCVLVPDYAFSDLEHVPTRAKQAKRLAISVRFWEFHNTSDPDKTKARYWGELKSLVEWWASEKDGETILVPTNYPTGGSRDDDLQACDHLLSLLPPAVREQSRVERSAMTAHDLRSLIASCAAFVGTRMHACIFALVVGTPVVVIPYQEKSIALMEFLNLHADVVRMDASRSGSLVRSIQSVIDRSAKGQRQLSVAQLRDFQYEHEVSLSRWMNIGSASKA